MLARGVAELEAGRKYRIVTWEEITFQKVAYSRWTLKEQKGDELKAHGITLRRAIEARDEIILCTTSHHSSSLACEAKVQNPKADFPPGAEL